MRLSETVGKAGRAAACVVLLYASFLMSLGPFWAVYGRGWLPIPRKAGDLILAAAYPVLAFEAGRCVFGMYLDVWYEDPDAYETTGCP
jgi:hypothetical protein